MDGFLDLPEPPGTVVLADDHTGTGGQAHEEANEHVHNGTHRAHGGECLVADIVAHHPGIHHVVHLLEHIARQQGQGKGDEVAGDVALGHIHILAPLWGGEVGKTMGVAD